MELEKFLAAAKKDILAHDVEIHLSDQDHVVMMYNGAETKCNGFFDDAYGDPPHPVLAWCTGKPFDQWFPIFIHEYNHFRQWVENEPTWSGYKKVPDFYSWLGGEIELSPDQALESCMPFALNEVDCDFRVVTMLANKELPLDPEHYIKTSNAYTWFYFWALEHRSWYTVGYEPYNTQAIIEAMPTVMPGIGLDIKSFNYRNYRRHYKDIFERHMLGADQNILFME